MRLSDFERDTLKRAAVDCFGSGTQVRLFGSRADDSRKGGDVTAPTATRMVVTGGFHITPNHRA